MSDKLKLLWCSAEAELDLPVKHDVVCANIHKVAQVSKRNEHLLCSDSELHLHVCGEPEQKLWTTHVLLWILQLKHINHNALNISQLFTWFVRNGIFIHLREMNFLGLPLHLKKMASKTDGTSLVLFNFIFITPYSKSDVKLLTE